MTIFDSAFSSAFDAVRLIGWWFGACCVDLSKLVSAEGEASGAKDAAKETEGK